MSTLFQHYLKIVRFIKENLFISLLIKNEDFKYKTRKFNGENNLTVKKCTVIEKG